MNTFKILLTLYFLIGFFQSFRLLPKEILHYGKSSQKLKNNFIEDRLTHNYYNAKYFFEHLAKFIDQLFFYPINLFISKFRNKNLSPVYLCMSIIFAEIGEFKIRIMYQNKKNDTKLMIVTLNGYLKFYLDGKLHREDRCYRISNETDLTYLAPAVRPKHNLEIYQDQNIMKPKFFLHGIEYSEMSHIDSIKILMSKKINSF